MTVQELHLKLDIAYSQLNTNKKLSILPEVKDYILNQAVKEYIGTVIEPIKNQSKQGFEETVVNYNKIQALVTDRLLPVYAGGSVYGAYNDLTDSDINPSSVILDNLKEVTFGYSYLPANYFEYGKTMLGYLGDGCINANLSTTLVKNEVSEYYAVLDMSTWQPNQYLTYTTETGVPQLNRTFNLIDPSFAYLKTYTKAKHLFTLVNHIVNLVHDIYAMGSPYRLEIAWEHLDHIYAPGCIIFKDNTKKFLPIDTGILDIRSIGIESDIPEEVVEAGTVLDSINFDFKKHFQYTDDITNKTKTALISNIEMMDIVNNYYYQKNKIYDCPVSIKDNVIVVSNLLPKYIPTELHLLYVRKPMTIDYQLNQMCELKDYDGIVAIAARIATAYINNTSAYQINQLETLK